MNQWQKIEEERRLIRAQKLWRRRAQMQMDRIRRDAHEADSDKHYLAVCK